MTLPTDMSLKGLGDWAEGAGNPPANSQNINADTVDDKHYSDLKNEWQNDIANSGGASSLNDLTDVSVTSPYNPQLLTYNGSQGKWVNNEISLQWLTDVDIGAINDGFILTFNGSTLKWEGKAPSTGGGGATSLNGLSDVSLSGQTSGQVLTYNGSTWVNQAASSGGGVGGQIIYRGKNLAQNGGPQGAYLFGGFDISATTVGNSTVTGPTNFSSGAGISNNIISRTDGAYFTAVLEFQAFNSNSDGEISDNLICIEMSGTSIDIRLPNQSQSYGEGLVTVYLT